jgi:hypothetical protein
MPALLPPLPVGVAPGSSYWNDWYEKLRTLVNATASSIPWSLITGQPTTLAGYGITDGQNISQKNAANGYAGLNGVSRTTKGVDSTDYIIVDSTTAGFTMKSPNGHYWVATISNLGVVTWTDVGTTKP